MEASGTEIVVSMLRRRSSDPVTRTRGRSVADQNRTAPNRAAHTTAGGNPSSYSTTPRMTIPTQMPTPRTPVIRPLEGLEVLHHLVGHRPPP